jgi:hypothetical protein
MVMMKCVGILAMAMALAACSSTSPLDKRYVSVRPDYGDKALPNPGEAPEPVEHRDLVNPSPVRNPPAPMYQDIVTGTWTFTTPPTTTRVERKNGGMSQFSIYMGRPAPQDKPLVVITVSADAKSLAESDPETYKVTGTRTYALNGNIAKEWTGQTSAGVPFNELMISNPGVEKGDVCHANAVARTSEERKLAIEILSSITWKANETPAGE